MCSQPNNKFLILNIDDLSIATHPVYKLHWYEDAALDTDRLLQEKATSLHGVSLLPDIAAPKAQVADDAVKQGKENESMDAISEQGMFMGCLWFECKPSVCFQLVS